MTADATAPTSDADRLWRLVETWKAAVDDVVALLRDLDEEDWSRPTDLPGWDVKAVAAHLAALESELSGVKQPRVELPPRAHVTSPMSTYTEFGVFARQDRTGPEVTDELAERAAARYEQLRQDPPTDPEGQPPRTPGRVGWDWGTLLGNRVVDVWMHDQDVRRAVGRPGGLHTAAATHTVATFAAAFGFVVGKRVAPPADTTVALEVSGAQPVHLLVEVGDDGRARPVPEQVERPTVTVRLGTEEFVVLAGGRRPVSEVPHEIEGDEQLGRQVLAALAVTP